MEINPIGFMCRSSFIDRPGIIAGAEWWSTFYGTLGQPADQAALHEKEKQRRRQGPNDGAGGKNVRPVTVAIQTLIG
ncbi:hypothetical protein ACCS53_38550, partial [Rhizobium ruizarguesonis]